MFSSTNNKSLFGTPNTSSAFGQPNTSAFGVQSTASTGPFGAQQPQQQSIFGTTSGQSLFGSTQNSIFGSTPNTTTTNAFGPQSTSGFGGTTSSIFGGNQQNNTLFGGNRFGTASTTSPFGSTSMAPTMPATNGTTVKFNATAGTDTMMKNGISHNINTRHQCITCMREYENKSLEELRLEDYTANRKGPQNQGGVFASQGVSSGNLFNTTTTPQNAFASTSSTGLFGQNKPSFGSIAPTTTSSSGLFGSFSQNKPMFGSNNTFPNVQTPAPTTSMFGAVSTSNPTLNSSFFSNTANTTAAVKPLFGAQTSQPQQSLFGPTSGQTSGLAQKPLFGNTATSVPQFGTNNTNTLFNTNNTSNLFTGSQPSLFSTGTTTTNSLNKPAFSFNPSQMPSLSSSIGGTGISSTPSLFGSTPNTFGTTGSMFGTNASNFNFSTNPSFPTNSFQPNVGLQPMSSPSQTVNTDQLVTRFQTFPYGDSPQLQIDVTIAPNTRVRTKFTTDPKTLNEYKISAKTVDNRPQRIVNNSAKMNAMLFDGLEDENSDENKSAKDIFVPRKNVKKLVFKPKTTSTMTDLSVSQNTSSISSNFLIQTHDKSDKFDDSIASDITVNEFNVNENRFQKQTEFVSKLTISPSERGDSQRLSSQTFDCSQSDNQTIDSESVAVIPKCGVILTRSDYYTIPSLEELDTNYDISTDSCVVDNFTVGRHNYGSIYWCGPLDVKGLNLDETVHIRRKEVIVYPDEDVAPREGQGLNRPAQITLHQVWPIDKTSHEVIKDSDRLQAMKWSDKIESATIKLGADFKEYRPDTGSWVFKVKHFSKYGLLEDDEEEDVVQPNDPSIQTLPKQVSPKLITETKRLFTKDIEHQNWAEDSILDVNDDLIFDKDFEIKDKIQLFDEEMENVLIHDMNQSLDYSSQMRPEFVEFDKIRSTLFDELDEVLPKKTKICPIVSPQKEYKSKLFSPMIPLKTRPVVFKKKDLKLEPDVFAAKNKLICDISSVCVSNSPKLAFFNGSRKFLFTKGSTVLICELNLIDFNPKLVDRFEEQLKNNSKVISSPNQLIAPFIQTRKFSSNSHNPLRLEQLVDALYGSLTETTPYACHQQRMDRIQSWLFSVNKKLSIPSSTSNISPYSKIMHFLSTNELEVAIEQTLECNNPRLALLLSSGTALSKDLMIAQLDSWKRSKADVFIDYDILKIYVLISGLIEWKVSNGTVVSVLEDLYWTQQLALILLYKTPPEVENNELGLNLLLTSISYLTSVPNEVEYHLMANSTPWLAMCWTSSPIDSWFLHESLKGFRVINDENDLISMSDCIHCFVSSQLEDIRWACFVATHIRHDAIREKTVKEIIARNSSQLLEDNDLEEWLLNEICVPNKYLSKAKAIKSKSIFDQKSLALNLIECHQWSEAHEVLMDWVFPQMIINDEIDSICELISKLKPNSHLISNWYSNGGHIYDTYLKCLQSSNIEDIKAFNIHQLRCNTKRHVLCQSEMARRVNIIFSELSGGQFAYNTPVPDDYALLELKINAKKLIKLLC